MRKWIKRTGVKRLAVCPKCKRKNVNLYPYGLFGWRCFKCGGRTYRFEERRKRMSIPLNAR